MKQQDNACVTPSSLTSVATQNFDSSLTVHRVHNTVMSSPPSPVPRVSAQGHARQTTRKHEIADAERKFFSYFPRSVNEVLKFATRENTTFEHVKWCAKHLGLRITRGNRGGRLINLHDRISFGLKSGVIKCLKQHNIDVKRSLFNFGMRIKTGFLQPSG